MKRFFRLALSAALVALVVAVPVFATEIDDAPPSSEVVESPVTLEAEADDKNIIVNVTLPAATPAPVEAPVVTDTPVEDAPPALSVYSVSTPDAVPPAEDSTAFTAVVTALFGTYTPRTQTVTQHLPDGSTATSQEVIPGVAGLDWPWLVGVALFALCLFCFFKLLGGVLKRG